MSQGTLQMPEQDVYKRQGPGRCLVTLREGKFHQVKRMLAQRGKPVLRLKRLSMGNLRLDEALKPGEFRPLTTQEVQLLGR